MLDANHEPRAATLQEWSAMFERSFDETRRVKSTNLGDIHVSTVFLGMDHNWSGEGGPVLFETMVFRGDFDEHMWRWRTWDEAVAGHDAIVTAIENGTDADAVESPA